jgi:hypothetical protein
MPKGVSQPKLDVTSTLAPAHLPIRRHTVSLLPMLYAITALNSVCVVEALARTAQVFLQ